MWKSSAKYRRDSKTLHPTRKYDVYTKFSNILANSIITRLLWRCVKIHLHSGTDFDELIDKYHSIGKACSGELVVDSNYIGSYMNEDRMIALADIFKNLKKLSLNVTR